MIRECFVVDKCVVGLVMDPKEAYIEDVMNVSSGLLGLSYRVW